MHPRYRLPTAPLTVLVALATLLTTATTALAQPPPIDCRTQLLGSSTSRDYFAVDIATGAGTSIAPVSGNLATEIEFDLATNTLWFEEFGVFDRLVVIDSVTGVELSAVTHTTGALNGLEFVDDVLYGTFIPGTGSPSDLVTVNTVTGALTTLGATGLGPISGLAYDQASGVMYGITAGGGTAQLVTLDLTNGTATVIGSTGLSFIGGIEFGPDGNLYGGLTGNASTNGQFLVRIDTASATTTPIGDSGFDISGLASCAPGPLIFSDSFESGDTSAW